MFFSVRVATLEDIADITSIYNQGIEDKTATLETKLQTEKDMQQWFLKRDERYKVLVVVDESSKVHGWASLNIFSPKSGYYGVADLSIYIRREMRGKRLGKMLLTELFRVAREEGFHKLVLSTFTENEAAQTLYKSLGFYEVGIYKRQGKIGDKWIDIMIMEKFL